MHVFGMRKGVAISVHGRRCKVHTGRRSPCFQPQTVRQTCHSLVRRATPQTCFFLLQMYLKLTNRPETSFPFISWRCRLRFFKLLKQVEGIFHHRKCSNYVSRTLFSLNSCRKKNTQRRTISSHAVWYKISSDGLDLPFVWCCAF